MDEIKDYFITEIKEGELMSKKLSKYIASFGYFYKSLIVLSVTTGGVSIASLATVNVALVGIVSARFSLAFSIFTEIVIKLFEKRNKKRRHNKIVIVARSKLNGLGSKISKALINDEISYEDFMTIINAERKYRELKESIRIMNSRRSDPEKKI